jgi:hypothetical protein
VTVATSSAKSWRRTTSATAIIDEFNGFSAVPRLNAAIARPGRGLLLTSLSLVHRCLGSRNDASRTAALP